MLEVFLEQDLTGRGGTKMGHGMENILVSHSRGRRTGRNMR